ncbi:MAG TPA: lipase maturation factor family protein, partial [Polyangia bacterium]|nr:lipase maturation factor family protein [Polyangia bacterium]
MTQLNFAPTLVWGLLSRGLALVYVISFASMANQTLVLAGTRGYMPLRDRLARIRRDFPSWRRFFYFPTLSWIHGSDALLGAFPFVGLAAAGTAFIGGPYSRAAFIVCYLVYLSLDRVLYLMFPWDSMMFEAGFFAMLLPPLHVLPDAGALVAPDPALAWVYRLLLFRVLLGFGKFKFLGSTRQDTGYLKGFLVNQPLPSPIAWYMQKLPMWMLKSALYFMFLVEIPLPFGVFWPRYSFISALAVDVLMLAIWLCGTFGYFSLIMMVVSLSWFDPETASAFSFARFFSPTGPVLLHALIFLHAIGALLSFPFNSYCTMTWINWPIWTRIRPRFLTAPITFYRLMQPFRWLHSYGVFPSKPSPPVKAAPVLEVTWDGHEWHALGHRFSPTDERSRPRFCAPHHARLDQALIYDVFGLSDASIIRNLVGVWDPYGHVHAGGSWHMMRRAVEGWMPSLAFDPKTIPARPGLPLAARVRSYVLEPTTLAEKRAT